MPSPPTSGLDKVIFSLDLSKGLDESFRPELIQDKIGITELNNMVQDQTGAWVKRPGMGLVAFTEENSQSFSSLRKVLRTILGTSVIQQDGYILDHTFGMNYVDKFRKKNQLPSYGVKGRFVASSGTHAQYASGGVRVLATASNEFYDAVVIEAGPGDVGEAGNQLVIYNKFTETEVVRYPLAPVGLVGVDANTVVNPRIAFSGNYLHVWLTAVIGAVNYLYIYVLSASPFPVDDSATTVILAASAFANSVHLSDITSDGLGNTWVTLGKQVIRSNNVGATTYGTFTRVAADPTEEGYAHSLYYASATDLWVVGKSADNKFLIVGLDPTAMTWSSAWKDAAVADVAGSYWAIAGKNDDTVCITRDRDPAFGTGSTVPKLEMWTADAANDTALTVGFDNVFGWRMVSCPWYSSVTNEYFIHLSKYDLINTLTPHVVVNLSRTVEAYTTLASDALPYRQVALEAVLEPYNATSCQLLFQLGLIGSPSGCLRNRYIPYTSSYTGAELVTAAIAYQSVSRSAGIACLELEQRDWSNYASENFGNATYISGGVVSMYDGGRAVEQGFADYPYFDADVTAVAGNPNGLYNYVAVYRYINAKGEATYSRTYGPVSVATAGAFKVRLTIQPQCVGNKETGLACDQRTVIDVYRTEAGGTQYLLCGTSQYDVQSPTQAVTFGGSYWSLLDNMSDATLTAQPVMYRQPGVGGAPVDRHISPPSKVLCSHKDRLFCTDAYGQRVFYSSFFVDGESAWFNPGFSFQVHGGSGPITGMASMDGRLIVFRQDSIFIVDGDGPPEGGGNGTEFSPPSKLSCEYGCIDYRSIVTTPEGIMFRSKRGIELLSRSLQVVWVGEKVRTTTALFPYTVGSFMDNESRVRWILWDTTNFSAGAGHCKELVFHMNTGAWSTATYDADNQPRHGIRTAEGARYACNGWLGYHHLTDKRDGASSVFVPSKLTTAHIKVNGPQGRQRVYEVMMLAKKAGNHAFKASLAYDYATSFTFSKTWEPAYLNTLSLQELNLNPSRQDVLAVQLKVEDQAPADTGTYPPGNGFELLDITFEVAAKQHAAKVTADSKG